ncbi:hypothetical protein NQZ68_021148 [Dissostichus eleginoides]|nr:hypothetical protein NQZ68_021148 [Dissostichus eleginoides]
MMSSLVPGCHRCQGCQWRPVVSTQHAVNVLDLETLTVAGVSCITSLSPLQPLNIQGVLQPAQAKSQIAFLGLGLVPAAPSDPLPNLPTGIVYQP